MADRIRYGLIGFGAIAEHRIAKEGYCLDRHRFTEHPAAVLTAACDVNQSRRGAAETLGLTWYESADRLLADSSSQAVFIATNNRSHFALAEQSLQAGKHCLIDKPAAVSRDEAEQLNSLAKKKRLSATVDHMMTFNAFNIKAAELVRSGAVGEVGDICTHMEFSYGSTAEEAGSWRCRDPRELGGPIGDVGSHCMYMAEFLCGARISELACVYAPEVYALHVENGAFIQYRMNNGLTGSSRVSYCQPRGGLEGTLLNLGFEIYGSQGILRAYGTLFQLSGHDDEPVRIRLEMEQKGTVTAVNPDHVRNIYQEQVRVHAESIQNLAPLDLDGAVHNLSLIISAHKSASSGGQFMSVQESAPA